MSLFGSRPPVPPEQARIECVGVNPLDSRRVDVAVDLTPCQEPLTVELVIVDSIGAELCCAVVVRGREWTLDKILHLRREAEPGEHVLHVGVFRGDLLLDHAVRRFCFPEACSVAGG
jgi:hypothetical protein